MDEWNGGWLNIWADGSMCTVTVHYNNNIFSISTVYHFLPKWVAEELSIYSVHRNICVHSDMEHKCEKVHRLKKSMYGIYYFGSGQHWVADF